MGPLLLRLRRALWGTWFRCSTLTSATALTTDRPLLNSSCTWAFGTGWLLLALPPTGLPCILRTLRTFCGGR